jgi:hypothetical protein
MARRLSTIDNIARGQKIEYIIEFFLKDEYDKVITTDKSSVSKISVDSSDSETYLVVVI